MPTRIDHLAIGAANLSQGVAYIKTCLGVDIPYGGNHVDMGTHNHLMQLGDQVYLELMAINPDVEPPERPRWFGLENAYIRRQLEQQPTLLTWVVSTDNLEELLQQAQTQAKFSFGQSELMSRGDIRWCFGIPDDGRLLAGGIVPYVMEWKTDIHPPSNLADLGCQFQRLEIYHPHPTWLRSVLGAIGAAELATIQALPPNSPPYLVAHIDTPRGLVALRSAIEPESSTVV